MVLESLQNVLQSNLVSQVILAALYLVGGLVIGRLARDFIKKLFSRYDIEKRLAGTGSKLRIGSLLGNLAALVIFMEAVDITVGQLNLQFLASVSKQATDFVIRFATTITILLAGYLFAIFSKDKIAGSKTEYSGTISKLVFFLIIYLALTLALPTVGVQTSLLSNILLVLAASIGLGAALAIGLGTKDIVRDFVRKRIRARKPRKSK